MDEEGVRHWKRANENGSEWLRVEEIGREGMSERSREREEERSRK